ncbi:serine hydrolase domain-containing protein [Pseudoduganella plicata]|nr:serine hydrolase domain-containing protein [Pseudoduganella plicata]
MKTMLGAVALATCFAAGAASFPEASPQSQGFATARLERLDRYLESTVARGDYLGVVSIVLRNGRVVDWRAVGHRDGARTQPLQRNAIFRIDAMTRTVTAAAMLILMEEGRLNLDDPVAAYLPELRSLRLGDGTAPRAAVTIRQLLSQTAGFGADAAAQATLDGAPDTAEYARRLAALPLATEPGSRFRDDAICAVVAGRVIEAVSGLRLDAFLHKRIFLPLQMRDTAFIVAPGERYRIAAVATTDATGALVTLAQPVAPGQRITPYLNGAVGLYSTAEDYARFAQMLADGGSLDGATVLGRKSVELMMQNHLSHLAPPTHDEYGAEGYGLGGSVVLDLARRARLGSVGQFGWTGAQSTWFTVDRQEGLVAVLMLQHVPQRVLGDPARPSVRVANLLYQALVR